MKTIEKTDNQRYVIFASDFPENKTREILADRNIPFKVLQGKYKGINEISYIVPMGSDIYPTGILDKQESMLFLGVNENGNRKAELVFIDGVTSDMDLGFFTEVTKEQAENSEAYTRDGDKYFICQERK
jgi:hypothetical protein